MHNILYKLEGLWLFVKANWLAMVVGAVLVFFIMMLTGLYGNEAKANECVSFGQFLSEVRADAPESLEISLAKEARGAAAAEFAAETGWVGEAVARVVLLVALDHDAGKVLPMAFSILVNEEGCVLATGAFPRDPALNLLTNIENKTKA